LFTSFFPTLAFRLLDSPFFKELSDAVHLLLGKASAVASQSNWLGKSAD